MKILIVGYGSIAKKHLSALNSLGMNPEVILLRSGQSTKLIDNYKNIFRYDDIPSDIDFSIISNPSCLHEEALKRLIPFAKPIFLEKPPLLSLDNIEELNALIDKYQTFIYTAFNMRFHPVILWIKEHVNPNKVIEIQAYCGSYLPTWRDAVDYRQIYSARKELGGGVHLDLIHELDFITHFLGFPQNTYKFFSKKSDLEINSVDSAHYWLEYEKCNVSVLLNYYRKVPKRTLEIVSNDEIYQADLIRGNVKNGSGEILFESGQPGILHTYIEQMKYFLEALNDPSKCTNTFDSAIKTLSICI